jgi:hypothetical protein
VCMPSVACLRYNSCPKWINGSVPGATTTELTSVRSSNLRHATHICHPDENGTNCDPVTYSGSTTQPTTDCQVTANTRLSGLSGQINSDVVSETTFDSVADRDQRSAEAQAIARVTPGYYIETLNQTEVPGAIPDAVPGSVPGGTRVSWDERWACQLNVTTVAPLSAENGACGCAAFGP